MEINHNDDILQRNPINIETNKEIISLNYLVFIELLGKFWLYLNGLTCLAVHVMVIILIVLVLAIGHRFLFSRVVDCVVSHLVERYRGMCSLHLLSSKIYTLLKLRGVAKTPLLEGRFHVC